VIHARGLARTFRKRKQEVRAVVGVDIDVEAGEIVGFLGPNGAGKTTTLRMLTTLLEPTAGTATVAGCDLITDPVGVPPPDRLRLRRAARPRRGPRGRGGRRPRPPVRA
jgi:ABC-2 type transport system ATP-binding protein